MKAINLGTCGLYSVYGVSLHAFVKWYREIYVDTDKPTCKAFRLFVSNETGYTPKPDAWDRILEEEFHENMNGELDMDELPLKRRKFLLNKLESRPDRILVCPCY